LHALGMCWETSALTDIALIAYATPVAAAALG
jgi:hypothetical protein